MYREVFYVCEAVVNARMRSMKLKIHNSKLKIEGLRRYYRLREPQQFFNFERTNAFSISIVLGTKKHYPKVVL
jgi:hypothetical protein